ncbi:putative precorrin-2 oxidase [Sulfobacillus acidophilus TPY]|uniref:precorrin-2 dehydrogenase n=1 Tax=Sulfobacillus acidophilus (strain ATCC 700253 / DSM 10332 / NAL) TaxID=679936 RepID=G8TU77_SULAD|nr:putative precorrin-2 oxidase [Sulfobacillus acidophilus TPY]AEW05749.1 precorrin-2 dehydrogenase [Sulfobacillus acidophilus DSM 10332]
MTNLYPVFLRLEKQPCLVVGGGRVALRKIRRLREAGADVTVISPDLHPELVQNDVIWINRAYEPGDVVRIRPVLVFAATNRPAVNRLVRQEAEEAGVWVNQADDPDGCRFMVPASVDRPPFHLAVSTGGTDPALAAALRRALEADLADGGQRFVTLLRTTLEPPES